MSEHQDSIGRSRSHSATLDPWPARALQATLDLAPQMDGEVLPPLWHWLYFLDAAPRQCLGPDGHPRNGSFLPELAQPRRMFAGATTRFHAPLRTGLEATMTESIRDVQNKRGSHGEMVIVTVACEYRQQNRLCIDEQRSLVFLPASTAMTEHPQAHVDIPQAEWSLDLPIDETLLFRYSALSFNSHRIHYDAPYATGVEGYPALVVQGPLTATLLAQFARQHCDAPWAEFSFRASAPLFCGQTLHLRGGRADDGAALTAYRPDGRAAMTATLRWR